MKIKANLFSNCGWLDVKLSKEAMSKLNQMIKDKRHNMNKELAGNITQSNSLIDKDNWFFQNVLIECIDAYEKKFKSSAIPKVLTRNCHFVLSRFWVNFQKKYEFNPLHNHSGVFSFVIWMKIPTRYDKEVQVPFVKHSNHKPVSSFQFSYVNALGYLQGHEYKLNPEDEGTMLFFPSSLSHQVYPFYTSNKTRISLSGNIGLDPELLV